MTDSETTAAVPPPPDQEPASSEPQSQEPKKPANSGITLSIWPPTQRTRDAVITRLTETLSTPSVLSKRYGTIPQEEASDAARRIEEEAFGVAATAASTEDDGLEVLQLYSKEISKRMLETVKARVGSGSTADNSGAGEPNSGAAAVTAAGEEVLSSVEAEA